MTKLPRFTYYLSGVIVFLFSVALVFHWPTQIRVQAPQTSQSGMSIAEELAECLPKSDMASKEKCDRLIADINSFYNCAQAGFPILDSYPEQCETPDGRTFVRDIGE